MSAHRHHTAAGLARLSELGKANIGRLDEMRAARAAKSPWPGRIPEIRRLVNEGATCRAIARHFDCSPETIKRYCVDYSIFPPRDQSEIMAAAAEVLRRMYPLPYSLPEMMAAYIAVRGPCSRDAMHQHARRINLRRPAERPRPGAAAACKARKERTLVERQALAAQVQAALDAGHLSAYVTATMGISNKRLQRMFNEGLIVQRERVKKIKAKLPPRPAKPAKVKAARARALPKSWARVEQEPKPAVVYQTVEAWLAAGNTIKQCPTVAAAYSPHITIPEADRAAMVALYAQRDAEAKSQKPGDAVRRIMTLRAKIATQAARMRT